VFVAEIVLLKVTRSLNSNSSLEYERVQLSKDDPDYKNINDDFFIDDNYAYAWSLMPAKKDADKMGEQTSKSVDTVRQYSNGDSARKQVPLPSLPPTSPTSPQPPTVVSGRGPDAAKLTLPPRKVGRARSCRQLPATPPAGTAECDAEKTYASIEETTEESDVGSREAEPDVNPSAGIYNLPTEDDSEPLFESRETFIEKLRFPPAVAADSASNSKNPLPVHQPRGLGNPLYSQPSRAKQPSALPDQESAVARGHREAAGDPAMSIPPQSRSRRPAPPPPSCEHQDKVMEQVLYETAGDPITPVPPCAGGNMLSRRKPPDPPPGCECEDAERGDHVTPLPPRGVNMLNRRKPPVPPPNSEYQEEMMVEPYAVAGDPVTPPPARGNRHQSRRRPPPPPQDVMYDDAAELLAAVGDPLLTPPLPGETSVYHMEKCYGSSGESVARSGASSPEADLDMKPPAAIYHLPDENVSTKKQRSPVVTHSASGAKSPVPVPRARGQVDVSSASKQPPTHLPDQSDVVEYEEVQEANVTPGGSVEEPTISIRDLSVQDVADRLREIHLDAFVDSFQRQGIDGTLLSHVDEEMLTSDFAMTRFQARKLMLNVKKGWRPRVADTSS